MATYVKRQVVIEAFQWKYDMSTKEYPTWALEAFNSPLEILSLCAEKESIKLHIKTLEGTMIASDGDFIIKGIKDELYQCKPDIFEELYDLIVEETEAPAYLSFTKEQIKELKKAFNFAVENNEESFIFDGNAYYTQYAKYLLQHLDNLENAKKINTAK